MNLRAFHLCSVVVIVVIAASLTISCGLSDTSQTANTSVPQPSMSPSPGEFQDERYPIPTFATDDTTEKDCLAVGKAFHSGDIKVISMKLKSGNYFAYPQIAGPRTPQERKFNLYVRKLLEIDPKNDEVCVEKVDPDCEDNMNENDEETGFSVDYATPEFLSIVLYSTTCGASCHVGFTPVNYDLRTGKPIKNLAELFKPHSNYLKKIASYCVRELKRCEGFHEEDGVFKKGTAPTADNYEIWSLTSDGVDITFPEYQIAGGAFPGANVLVPYSHLQGMLRQDVDWFRRLKR